MIGTGSLRICANFIWGELFKQENLARDQRSQDELN